MTGWWYQCLGKIVLALGRVQMEEKPCLCLGDLDGFMTLPFSPVTCSSVPEPSQASPASFHGPLFKRGKGILSAGPSRNQVHGLPATLCPGRGKLQREEVPGEMGHHPPFQALTHGAFPEDGTQRLLLRCAGGTPLVPTLTPFLVVDSSACAQHSTWYVAIPATNLWQ